MRGGFILRIGEGAVGEGTVLEEGEGGEDQNEGEVFSEMVAEAFDGAGFHDVDVVLGGVQDGGDFLGGEAVDVGHSEDVAVREILEAFVDDIEYLGPYAFEVDGYFGFGVVELGEVPFGVFSGGVLGAEDGGAAVTDDLVEVVAEVFGGFDLVAGFPGEREGGVDDVVEVGVAVAEDFKGIDVDGAVVFLEDAYVAVGAAGFVGLEPGWVFVFRWWGEHEEEGRKFCGMVIGCAEESWRLPFRVYRSIPYIACRNPQKLARVGRLGFGACRRDTGTRIRRHAELWGSNGDSRSNP